MSVTSILHQCEVLGVCLTVKDDRLQIQAPKGIVTTNLLNNIKELKDLIIDYLRATRSSCSTRSSVTGVCGIDQVVNQAATQQLDQTHTHQKVDQVERVDQVDQLEAREAYEERAAIMEYCGGLSREDAEREARRVCGFDSRSEVNE